jgi:hypothetical protein
MRARLWLTLTTAGCAMIVLAMIAVALVILDKPHFGWLVGTLFLQVVTSGVLTGSLLFLIGAWKLPNPGRWRRAVLLVWGLIALTSPAFGFLFLLPWSFLVLSLPLVITILIGRYRDAAHVHPAVSA